MKIIALKSLTILLLLSVSQSAVSTTFCSWSKGLSGMTSAGDAYTKKEAYDILKSTTGAEFSASDGAWHAFEDAVKAHGLKKGYYHCTWSVGGVPKAVSFCYMPSRTGSTSAAPTPSTPSAPTTAPGASPWYPGLPPRNTTRTRLWEIYADFVRLAELAAAAGQQDAAKDYLQYSEQIQDMINGL